MVVVLLGPPGVGKGTQCRLLVERAGWSTISTGEILRQAIQKGTDLGRQAKGYMERGELLPDGVMTDLVRSVLTSEWLRSDCLLDGFPRTIQQAQDLDLILHDQQTSLRAVVSLTADPTELQQRMLRRAEQEGRSDDTPETISIRLETYRRQTEPLVDYYRHKGLLLEVNGLGTPEVVHQRIRTSLGL